MSFLSIKAPEIFSKESDVELWLSRFKRYITAQGDRLTEEEVISIFATLLDDECYRLFDSVGFKQNWIDNERTLIALFAKPTVNPHVYLQQFTTRTQRPDENVSQFAAALHDMANKSLGMRGGIENFIKEQFILGLRDQQIADKLRYSHFESGRLRIERDRAIDELSSMRSEIDRVKRELEEAKRQTHVNDFICPICLEPVLKEKAMAPDCGHVICESCERSWTQSLDDQNPPGYRCPSCNLHSTPVRLF